MAADSARDRPPAAAGQPPWPPVEALESRGPPPDRRPPLRPSQIVAAGLLALGAGALLGSGALVGLAERQPLGTQRDVALGAAEAADRVARGLSLNRPAESLARALDGEEEVYDVDALIARARATAARRGEPRPAPVAGAPEGEGALSPAEPEAGAEPAAWPSEPERHAAPPRGDEHEGGVAGDDEPEGDAGEFGEVPWGGGPPPDGLITPIEGVDCVLEDATAPTTTAGGVEDPGPEAALPEGADETQALSDDPTACPAGYVVARPGAGATDGAAPEGETAEPVLFDAPRTPDADEPLRMYVGGDSISRDLGEGLARATPAALVRIELDPRPATGLSRPDFFDWSQHLAGVLTESLPDVIVVLFGANDFQNVEHEGEILDRYSEEWLDLYRRRVGRIMTLLGQPDTQTVWVGQPPVRESRLSGGLARMNEVYEAAAAEHPQVAYVDTWALFSDADGGYTDEIDGVRLRRGDGVHLTVAGGNRLAEAVWDAIGPAWGLDG
ncbi:MAG: DUF459 domain-containing protein [bacterium]|nr:DUF459 domain-containing protein [bacterium]